MDRQTVRGVGGARTFDHNEYAADNRPRSALDCIKPPHSPVDATFRPHRDHDDPSHPLMKA